MWYSPRTVWDYSQEEKHHGGSIFKFISRKCLMPFWRDHQMDEKSENRVCKLEDRERRFSVLFWTDAVIGRGLHPLFLCTPCTHREHSYHPHPRCILGCTKCEIRGKETTLGQTQSFQSVLPGSHFYSRLSMEELKSQLSEKRTGVRCWTWNPQLFDFP